MTPADELRHAAAQWERLLAAMEGDCPSCGGSGRVVNGAWKVWYSRSSELVRVAQVARQAAGLPPDRRVTITSDTGGFPRIDPAIAPHIEAPAVVVAAERAIDEHQNTRPREPEQMTCPSCHGHGRALTVIGAQVADLLSRHGFVRRSEGGPIIDLPAPSGQDYGRRPGDGGGGGAGGGGAYGGGYGPGGGGHDTGAYDPDGYERGGYDPGAYDPRYDTGPYGQGGGGRDRGGYDGGPRYEPY